MNKDKYKKLLEEKKHQLEQELDGFAKRDPNVQGDWDSKFPRTPEGNLEEAAGEVEEYSTRLHVEYSLETQLKDIGEALERIKKGTYGVCITCGKRISPDRLSISPAAKTCQKCNV
jgi:DnaK suppressor protein